MGVADWLERLRWPLSVAVLALGALAAALLLRPQPAPPLTVLPPDPSPRAVSVYVSGAVVNPGVYPFLEGARVEEALKAAGGPTADADLDRLNLSIRLRDEMHVQVPHKVAAIQSRTPGSAAEVSDVVNLNTASAADLEALPGIGPVTAKRILDHRQSNGPFRRSEELVEAKLVSLSTFEKIKSRITAP